MIERMSEEKWLPVVGRESDYEVSDHGNVRWRSSREPVRSYRSSKTGHRNVYLPGGPRLKRDRRVHRLVLEAFVGPCPEGLMCCHNDGVAWNNHVDNLRWDTASSNMHDRVTHGIHHYGSRTHCSNGHPLDVVKYTADGSFKQRRCRTCLREQNRANRAKKMTCPQGHPFDGIAYKPDGTVRQRYCSKCRSESVSRQMTERNAVKQTHCKRGHLIEGVRMHRGREERYCVTCNGASSAASAARKKAKTMGDSP